MQQKITKAKLTHIYIKSDIKYTERVKHLTNLPQNHRRLGRVQEWTRPANCQKPECIHTFPYILNLSDYEGNNIQPVTQTYVSKVKDVPGLSTHLTPKTHLPIQTIHAK